MRRGRTERRGPRRRRALAGVPAALRSWALGHPHEWGLIFGTPVPGYEAPEDTVEPYARVAAALVRPLVDAEAAGRLRLDGARGAVVGRAARRGGAGHARGSSPACRSRRWCWRSRRGRPSSASISLEVFGHWRNTVLDPGEFFEATIRDVAESIGLH